MKDQYFTIKAPAEGTYKEKGSKFIAYAFPVGDETEVELRLDEIRKAHHSARHHCYAYRLGLEGELYRVNDDGEPSGSAGKPIYGQLLSFELSDILVVVVRYFGGTKLGVGGLIQAYKQATRDALEKSSKKEVILCDRMRFQFDYSAMNFAMQLVEKWGLVIEEQNFTDQCEMKIAIRRSNSDRLKAHLQEQILLQHEPLD